jgi:alpha-L-fucosidase 2
VITKKENAFSVSQYPKSASRINRILATRAIPFIHIACLFLALIVFKYNLAAQPAPKISGLRFNSLPDRWDEAIPLGNGMLGALIYKKDGKLRISIDRADLWDLRPIKSFYDPDFSYHWIYKQVSNHDYRPVEKFLTKRDITAMAPTKIPAGAIVLPLKELGKVRSVSLNVSTATCRIDWENGIEGIFFISANRSAGYFKFSNLPAGVAKGLIPQLEAPRFKAKVDGRGGSTEIPKDDVTKLGYPQGTVKESGNLIDYHQPGWGNFSYDITVNWKSPDRHTVAGSWTITSHGSPYSSPLKADEIVKDALSKTFDQAWLEHKKWWKNFWQQSAIHLPDTVLMHQYAMDMYFFGSASRQGAPPISLQAVWTADNGRLPPWRGDFHNDLNTQLSYWPGYASNHMQESAVFTDWLWNIRPVAKKYTEHIFKDTGLNVPGVATLTGAPRGQWAQYTFSPTVSCWLSQYFYWQWIYSADNDFLRTKAYPWIKATADHVQSIAIKKGNGQWQLPISSSPEIFDNKLKAWFLHTSNFDLSLIRWLLRTAIRMADTLHLDQDAHRWQTCLSGWPQPALNPADSALLIAPGTPYSFSHRHFSHLIGIFPLQSIDWFDGEKDQKIIQASLEELKKFGPSAWTGYSYAWQGCLKAMAQDGNGACRALKIFATAFCSPNGFHLNGDQSGKGYSGFRYRPFTLEGNCAFAEGIQLMLLQQHNGINYLFPAIPKGWKNVSFEKLRAPGAFLISAKRSGGRVISLEIMALKGGSIQLENPFFRKKVQVSGMRLKTAVFNEKTLSFFLKRGQQIGMQIMTSGDS